MNIKCYVKHGQYNTLYASVVQNHSRRIYYQCVHCVVLDRIKTPHFMAVFQAKAFMYRMIVLQLHGRSVLTILTIELHLAQQNVLQFGHALSYSNLALSELCFTTKASCQSEVTFSMESRCGVGQAYDSVPPVDCLLLALISRISLLW